MSKRRAGRGVVRVEEAVRVRGVDDPVGDRGRAPFDRAAIGRYPGPAATGVESPLLTADRVGAVDALAVGCRRPEDAADLAPRADRGAPDRLERAPVERPVRAGLLPRSHELAAARPGHELGRCAEVVVGAVGDALGGVPDVALGGLEVRTDSSRSGVERQDGVGGARGRGVIRVAGPHVDAPELGVDGWRRPHRAPVVSARNGVPAPSQLARLRVDRHDVPAHVDLRVAQLAVERRDPQVDPSVPHRRAPVDVGVLLRVDGDIPELGAVLEPERDQPRVVRLRDRYEHAAAADRHRAVDRLADLIVPAQLAGPRVHSDDVAAKGARDDLALGHGRRSEEVAPSRVKAPGNAELREVRRRRRGPSAVPRVREVLPVGRPARLADRPPCRVQPDVVGIRYGGRRGGGVTRPTAADPGLRRRSAATRRCDLQHALHPRVQRAVEVVGAGLQRLDAAHGRGLPAADQSALELPVVIDQVVLREVVEVRECELVALGDRDRGRRVVHRRGVRLVLRGVRARGERQRRDERRDGKCDCLP